MKTITQYNENDVAKEAGTSVASVSRVLNGVSGVGSGVIGRVKEAARKLDYYPDYQGRSLRSGKRRNIALLRSSGSLTDELYSERFAGEIARAITAEGYGVSTEFLLPFKNKILPVPDVIKGRRSDGLIIVGHLVEDALAEVGSWGLPVCLINNQYDKEGFISVGVDDHAGVCDAVRFLAAQGHRRIGFVHGTLEWPSTHARHKGYLDAMRELNLPVKPEYIVQVADDRQNYSGGYEGTKKLLHDTPDLDAILYLNDWYAVGGLCAAKELGRRIPEDLSLMGFDGHWLTKGTVPVLATMNMVATKISRRAAELIIRIIEDRPLVEANIMVRPELIKGESTAPRNNAQE